MPLASSLHYFQCNRIKFCLSFINDCFLWHSKPIQQPARIGKIFAPWHLAIAITSLGKNFLLNLSGVRNVSPTYNGVRFFFSIIRHEPYFFSVQGIFFPGIYLRQEPPDLLAFFLSKSVCRTFFLKSPINPSKVKWSAPKIHQTFGQLTDSNLSIIFFETIGDKTL